MKSIAVFPFYSQVNKLTGKFKLKTCADTKWALWFLDRVRAELGWVTALVTPLQSQCEDAIPACALQVDTPLDPRERRLWEPVDFLQCVDADVFLCMHETMPRVVRRAKPKATVLGWADSFANGEPWPETYPLFVESWKASDLVVSFGELCARHARMASGCDTTVWPMAYDEDEVPLVRGGKRAFDICFVHRGSATNYTKHEEWLRVAEWLPYTCVYPDVTGFFRKEELVREHQLLDRSKESYLWMLRNSLAFVSLRDDLYGGFSPREALRSGCFPLVPKRPCYVELLGVDWPWFLDDADTVSSVKRAMREGLGAPLPVKHESYQDGWRVAKPVLEAL